MKNPIPQEVINQMDDNERVVGHMVNLFKETLVFTKKGCNTKDGCTNFLYQSENDYEKLPMTKLNLKELSQYERHFVSAFLWN
jgi:hypothetical protein